MIEFQNIPADGVSEEQDVRCPTGRITFVAAGTFGADTITLQVYALGQWLDVTDGTTAAALTAPSMVTVELTGNLRMRVKRTGSTGSGLQAGIF